jgi:hypothetical protein
VNRRMMLVVVPALALAGLVSSDRAGAKGANIFQLLTGFSSKETCSCAFVAEQTDEYCKAFGQSAGYEVEITIDRTTKTVSSSFSGVTRTATMKEGEGCVGDALP